VARPRRTTDSGHPQAYLFSLDPAAYLPMELASRAWPDPSRFPVNHSSGRVRQQVWADLTRSINPTVIAGFSSIGQLIELIAAWANEQQEGSLRVLLGRVQRGDTREPAVEALKRTPLITLRRALPRPDRRSS
jgi:hypothetical protein